MMPRLATALVTALVLDLMPLPAACASARAAVALEAHLAPPAAPAGAAAHVPSSPSPFPIVPLRYPAPAHSHLGAYLTLAAGAGLVGTSFAWQARANRTYGDYLRATEPGLIAALYDRAAHYDRLSSAALLGGEALVATGLWMRFIRHPAPGRVALDAGPRRCALALRF